MNVLELKGLIARNGLTQKQVAEKLKMTPKTFSVKMRKGTFGIDEANQMIRILHIENPSQIFFDHK